MTHTPRLKVYGPDEVDLSDDNISASTDQVVEKERVSVGRKIVNIFSTIDRSFDKASERVGDATVAAIHTGIKTFFSKLFPSKKDDSQENSSTPTSV